MITKRIKRIVAFVLCATILTGVLVGCRGSNTNSSGGNKKNKPIVLTKQGNKGTSTTDTFTMDVGFDYIGQIMVNNGILEGLFYVDSDTQKVMPHLATEYKQIDNSTWEITIRDGVSFTNGKPLNAEACKKSLEYSLSKLKRFNTLADVASMEANGQKLTIKTKSFVATLPNILADVNLAIFETEGSGDFSKTIIGTGPYILESADAEGNCVLVRNDNYWQGKPGADKIVTKAGIDNASVPMALQSGEIDWATVKATDLGLFKNNDKYKIYDVYRSRVYFLYINPNHTFTKDNALREALTYAFDREAILSGVYNNAGKVTKSIYGTETPYYDANIQQPEDDKEKAKQILTSAGYIDSDGDGFVEKNGEKVTLNITTYSSNNFGRTSEVLQSMLKDIGIDSKIIMSEKITVDLQKSEFNIATYGFNTLTMGDCYNYIQGVFHADGTSNFNKLNDAEINSWIDEMKNTADASKRAELCKKIQKKVYATNSYLYLMHIVEYKVVKSEIKNFDPCLGNDNGNQYLLWKVTKNNE